MGPRPDGRGTKIYNPHGHTGGQLQWGRDRMAAERCEQGPGLHRHVASMGPRPDGRGTFTSKTTPITRRVASMGPRPDGRGTIRVICIVGLISLASMGPRPDGRGTVLALALMSVASHASMGPRPDGRGTPAPSRSPAPGHWLQWGRDRMAAERRGRACRARPCRSFNGAATGWPRNVGKRGFIMIFHVASMGPRPDGRGTCTGGAQSLFCLPASMGPRPDGRGTVVPRSGVNALGKLQWGRDRMAAERPSRSIAISDKTCFNGAATGWPRNAACKTERAERSQSFNGAATGWPRNAWRLAVWAAAGRICFNGAATGWPRNGPGALALRCLLYVLQWGRDRMAAERGRLAVFQACEQSFNGAATGWPRNGERR